MNNTCRPGLVLFIAASLGIPASVWSCGGGDEYVRPSLSDYAGIVPGRSLARILLETGGNRWKTRTEDAQRKLSDVIRHTDDRSPDELLKAMAEVLELARQQHLPKAFFAKAHDIRDLLSANAVPTAEMGSYAIWRDQWETDEPLPAVWDRKGDWIKKQNDRLKELTALVNDCEKGARPKGLLPHFLYAMGACYFHQAKDVDSEKWFARVVNEFPDHPRAEAAMFMVARSALSQTRSDYGGRDGNAIAAARALKAFDDYLKRYPEGRFAGDAVGWEGALHYDAGNYLEALRCCAKQLDFPGHPELAMPAAVMCEKCLRYLCETDTGTASAMSEVAHDPALMTALVYHVLSASPPGRSWDEPPVSRTKWRKDTLQAVAVALSKSEGHFGTSVWQPRFLAILAQSLSASGHQKEALDMLNRNVKAGYAVEDWCFAKALVLERSDRLKAALEAYDDFMARFPQSVWRSDANYHRAGVLKDLGDEVQAIVTLRADDDPKTHPDGAARLSGDDNPLLPETSEDESIPNYISRGETLTAMFFAAPVARLAKLSNSPSIEEPDRKALKALLARRLIAQSRYEDAVPFLPEDQVAAMELRKLSGKPDAATWLHMARLWSASRGRWLAFMPKPKDALEGDGSTESFVPGQHFIYDDFASIRNDMATLGYEASAEYQRFDELVHALDFCRKAIALAPATTATGAEARLLALDIMPVLARSTGEKMELARRDDWTSLSRKWWTELQSGNASLVATGRAVYWSFDKLPATKPAAESADWRTNSSAHPWIKQEWAGDPDLVFAGFGGSQELANDSDGGMTISLLKQLAIMAGTAERADMKKLRTEIAAMHKDAQAARAQIADFVLNAVDDLMAVASVPGVPDRTLVTYVSFRIACLCNAAWGNWNLTGYGLQQIPDKDLLSQLGVYQQDHSHVSVQDFWDALQISLEANSGRDWVSIEKLCNQFLAHHPKSTKREAVSIHRVRAAYRAKRPDKSGFLARWSALGFDADNWSNEESKGQWDAAPVLTVIADYRSEFPAGRLSGEVDVIEGLSTWRAGLYSRALQIAAHGLEPASTRQVFSAALLANVCADLEKPESRAAAIEALRHTTVAHEPLRQYLDIIAAEPNAATPLIFMANYLRDQVLGTKTTK